ncbi:MAG TPA: hypothetical protein VMF89_08385, partial [Polyangiales bacterium]|nr:hypothetical protein [Polyangiales bacterium]
MTLKQSKRALGLKLVLACALSALGCAADPRLTQDESSALEGELEVVTIDYEDGLGDTEYALKTAAGELLKLSFASDPGLASGERIRVKGQRSADDVVVDEFDVLGGEVGEKVQALTGNTLRTQTKLAVLMVHWGTPDTQTAATLRSKLFTNTNSTNVWYGENSYNLFAMQGDVFGWYQVPAMQNCDYRTLATNARAAAQSAGVNLSAYKQILYYFPRSTQCS